MTDKQPNTSPLFAMVQGPLAFDVKSGTSASGNAWARATVRAAMGEAIDLITVVAFGSEAAELARLQRGQIVQAAGRFELSHYEKNGEKRLSATLVCGHIEILRRPKRDKPIGTDPQQALSRAASEVDPFDSPEIGF